MARWTKGKSGNPNGRPKGSRNKSTGEIKDLLSELVSFDELVKKLDALARKGNVRAAELLLAYRFGRPVGHEEIDIHQDAEGAELIRKAEEAITALGISKNGNGEGESAH